ncbi:DUF2306 domain-containing protein [Paenibacillus sp. N1-5-1-14]|uniref:DUF2306 domain-containing protein n=1 Tax=Paenibacillus radicibacter TaxID=2972488 RepID=UPI00215980F3|nr:DUF2306 domain-containing protein [Paenibacillus radicibacter]MCR8644257.1 DUF2306 domain-containing protein [Paenibacillus radicibacter]
MTKRSQIPKRWLIVVILTLGAAIFAITPYVPLDSSYSRVTISTSFTLHYPLLLTHIFSSFIALVIGWLQFLPTLRKTRPHIHRIIGRIYLSLVAIGGITGIVVGMYTDSYIRQMSFLTLVLLWLYTGWKGYTTARNRNFNAHRKWMIRNYAVTLVAATARLVTPICILIYLVANQTEPFTSVEAVLKHVLEVNIWVGLVVNIVISEWLFISPSKNTHNH